MRNSEYSFHFVYNDYDSGTIVNVNAETIGAIIDMPRNKSMRSSVYNPILLYESTGIARNTHNSVKLKLNRHLENDLKILRKYPKMSWFKPATFPIPKLVTKWLRKKKQIELK